MLIVETLTEDLILGRDFLKQHKYSVELGEQNLLRLTEAGITVALGCSTRLQKKASVAAVTCQPSKGRKETHRDGRGISSGHWREQTGSGCGQTYSTETEEASCSGENQEKR